MDMFSANAFRQLLIFAPAFILSLSFHEYAHAWVADKLGDSTARYLGRLTIDPMAHISVIGTIVVPAIAVLTGAPLFGWANPVPIDQRNFKNPRAGMAMTAAAGPVSNIILAVLCTAILSVLAHHSNAAFAPNTTGAGMTAGAIEMLVMSVQLNLFLAFFNLIPIPPLDGSRILQGFVSRVTADKIDQWSQYGNMLLLVLFISGMLNVIARPVFMIMNILFALFQIS